MAPDDGAQIEEKIIMPSGKAQEAQDLKHGAERACRRQAVVEGGIAEGRKGDEQSHQGPPTFAEPDRQEIKQEKHEEGEREPVTAFGRAEPAEEQRRRSQQQQEDEGWHNLHHELLADHLAERPTCRLLKEPAADHEETRQTEKEKHVIKAHRGVAETETADMGIDDENHRESPHRINISDSGLFHFGCKNKQKSRNSWPFL